MKSCNRLGHARVKKLVLCHSNMNLLYGDDGVEDDMFVDFYETALPATADKRLLCRPDQFSRSSCVDYDSCLLVSGLHSLFYTMSSHRDIYIYEC
jgi:hypothetical protein